MNSAVIAFLTCLLVFSVQGQQVRSNKCKCSNGYISGRMSKHLIKTGPVVHDPSVFCPRTEIIITMTSDKEKCVNPQSPLGHLILKNRQEKNGAVSKTTASSSTSVHTTSASSSTSVHTTSRL